jgi:hypothetical protein
MKTAKVFCTFFAVLGFFAGSSSPALSREVANIVNTVRDTQGNPIQGMGISVHDTNGKVITRVVTNEEGRAVMEDLDQGQYQLALDPLMTGFQGGTVDVSLGTNGLVVNWTVSSTSLAATSVTPGSGAGGILGLGTTGSVIVGAPTATGVGVGAAALGGAFDGGGNGGGVNSSSQ